MVWVNLDLEEEIHTKAKKQAVDKKQSLKQYLIGFIESGVKQNE